MSGPWDDYKKPEKAAEQKASGPWDDYAAKPQRERVEITGPDLAAAGKNVVNFFSGDGGAIGEGVPVLGPLARKAGEYFRAGVDTVTGEKPFSENLASVQGENTDRQAKFSKENPATDVARKIVGGIGGAGAVPIIGAGVPGLLGSIGRVASTTGLAAGDMKLRGGSNEQTKGAAAFGGGAQLALEAIPVAGKVLGPIARPLADAVEGLGGKISESGFGRATKSMLGNLKTNYKPIGNEARVADAGEKALDAGIVKFGSKAGAMGRRAEKAAGEAWEKVEGVFKAADDAGVKVTGAQIADKIRAKASKLERIRKNENLLNEMEAEASQFEAMGEMTLSRAQELKGNYDWKRDSNKLTSVLGKNGNNAINEAFGETIKDTVKGSSLPGAEEFVRNYQNSGLFGSLAKGAKATSEQQNRSRSPFSLTDTIVGSAGGTAAAVLTGDARDATVAGLVLAAANSLARTRGNSAMAVSLNNLGRVISASPDKLGRFYGVLTKAAEGGQASLAATHAALLQREPEYRKLIEPNQSPKTPNGMPIAPEGPMERRLRGTGE